MASIPDPGNIEDHGLLRSTLVAQATAPAPQNSPVQIANFAFAPATLDMSAGTQVTWTNKQNLVHDVTADDNRYHSDTLDANRTYSQTYSTPRSDQRCNC